MYIRIYLRLISTHELNDYINMKTDFSTRFIVKALSINDTLALKPSVEK